MACRPGGIVSIIGVNDGLVDNVPMGAFHEHEPYHANGRALHLVYRHLRPLLDSIQAGDPSFVVTRHLELEQAPQGYATFKTQAGR